MITERPQYFKRIFIAISIFLIISIPGTANAKLSDVISFNSYFDIDYNPSLLNQELKINKSINIPITIIYTSDLPEEVVNKLKFLTINFMWRNQIIFNRSMIQQIVSINLTNTNDITWAHVNLTQNKIYIDEIPYYKREVRLKTSLIISPFEEAPAETEIIKLKISCENLGILKGEESEFIIQFKPRFSPFITITPEESLRLANPRESINYKILIKNHSNKRVRIDSEIITGDPRWFQSINPQSLDIDPNDTSYFMFSAITPDEFGWHDERQEFKINVHVQKFPIWTNNSLNRSYELTLKAKNYGISTPGFTVLGVFTIISLFSILKKMNSKHKRSGK